MTPKSSKPQAFQDKSKLPLNINRKNSQGKKIDSFLKIMNNAKAEDETESQKEENADPQSPALTNYEMFVVRFPTYRRAQTEWK
jgi:hypothetical protein